MSVTPFASLSWRLLALASFVAAGSSQAEAQRVHRIRLEGEGGEETYRFTPASVTARPGDVLIFKVASGAPHSVVFEGTGLSPAEHAALNAALGRRSGDLTGPTLPAVGVEYRLVVPTLRPGRYSFYCLPHRAYDERGELRVER